MKTCQIPNCTKKHFSKGKCRFHYFKDYAIKNGLGQPHAKRMQGKKPQKVKKIKLRPIRRLIKDLDSIFSKFIRLRDTVANGNVLCFTCGKLMPYKESQNGHFISRRHYATRWEEKNCAAQCSGCNIFNQGAGAEFAGRLIQKYGVSIIDLLLAKKNSKFKLERTYLEILIREYTIKVAELQEKLEENILHC